MGLLQYKKCNYEEKLKEALGHLDLLGEPLDS